MCCLVIFLASISRWLSVSCKECLQEGEECARRRSPRMREDRGRLLPPALPFAKDVSGPRDPDLIAGRGRPRANRHEMGVSTHRRARRPLRGG